MDGTSDIEAAVERRLMMWSDAPESGHKDRVDNEDPTRRVSKRRKKRRRSQVQDPRPGPAEKNELQAPVMEFAGSVNMDVLQNTLIRPRSTKAKVVSTPDTRAPSTGPELASIVVRAKDIESPLRSSTEKTSRSKRAARAQPLKADDNSSVDASEYVEQHRREVGRFGSKALNRRDRKNFEAAELLRLGCRAPKKEKMPIGLLVGLRKRQKVRAEKKKEMDIASGMLIRSKRRR